MPSLWSLTLCCASVKSSTLSARCSQNRVSLEHIFNRAGAQPPSTAASFTRCVAFAIDQPEHMDVDEIQFRPTPGAVSIAGLFSVRKVAYAGSLQPGVLSEMAIALIYSLPGSCVLPPGCLAQSVMDFENHASLP